MGRTKFTKEILSQIDRATNPDRKLGKIKVGAPKVLRFTEQEEIDNPQGVSFKLKKRYYSFDRGSIYALDKVAFSSFAGKIFYGEVATNVGNFIDDGFLVNTNLHYSVQVFSDKARTVKLKITSPACSIVILNNLLEQFNSRDGFFSTGIIDISLLSGWNTLDIFYYRQRTGGYLKIEGDLGNHISAWRSVDFEPPTKPQWHSTPLVSEYIDPNDFGQFHNVLRWKKYPSDVASGELEDIVGWDIYRSIPVNLVNTGGSNVTVVSGWGTDGFVVSGDYRSVLPSEGTLYSPTISDDYTISGTVYPGGTSAESYTVVTVSGTFSPGLSASDAIFIDHFKPISSIGNHPSLPLVVSGLDKDVLNGETYNYYIKAIDNSPNRNKSTKSDIQTVVAGDTSPPDPPSGLSVVTKFRDITLLWTPPTDVDLAGYAIFVDGTEVDRFHSKQMKGYTFEYEEDGNNLDPAVEYTLGVKAFDYAGNLSTLATTSSRPGAIEGGQDDYDDDDNDGFWMGYDVGNAEYRMSMKGGEQKLTMTSSGLNVVSGTITAGIVQTATSGQRMVMDGSNNTFKMYDSGGNNVIIMDDTLEDYLNWGGNFGPGILIDSEDLTHKGGIVLAGGASSRYFSTNSLSDNNSYSQVFPGRLVLSKASTNVGQVVLQLTSTVIEPIEDMNGVRIYQLPEISESQSLQYADFVLTRGDRTISDVTTFSDDVILSSADLIAEDASFNDVIVSGTITGTIQTASSGQRVIMASADNTIKFFDNVGNQVVTIDDNLNSWLNLGIDVGAGILIDGTNVGGFGGGLICTGPAIVGLFDTNDLVSYSDHTIIHPGIIALSRKSSPTDISTHIGDSVQIRPVDDFSTGRIYELPDAGDDANFVLTEGNQTINGDTTFTAELKGTKGYLAFGENTAISTDAYLKGPDGITTSATIGYRMIRDGSITGISLQTNVIAKTDNGDLTARLIKGGTPVFSVTKSVTATGIQGNQDTQTRGTDTFSAGDIISVDLVWVDGLVATVDDTVILVEFYDDG